MRRFVISDIHGCAKTFKALINKISFSQEDELYLLGDYVDRGPDSRGVIDHIWDLQNQGYTIHCLRGNHEQMFLHSRSISDDLSGINEKPGYAETLASFGTKDIGKVPQKYIDWINGLKYFIEIDNYILVHAGLSFRTPFPLTDNEQMIWIRHWYEKIDKNWLGDRLIVHGHTPTRQLEIKNSIKELEEIPAINIDNGCCFESFGFGHLCALELGTKVLTFQANVEHGYSHL